MATDLPPETLAAFGGDELRARIFLEKYALRDLDDRIVETLPQQMWDRVARELAGVEATPELRERWRREFRWLLDGFRFLPGGRTLHGAANPRKVTLINCFVEAIQEDSLEGIYTAAMHAARTYSRGGGVGCDISPLRPAGSLVHNAARHSTGAVSFMELFSLTTGLIGQCLVAGTPVLTPSGWLPIEQLQTGDHVWTHVGWRPITHTFAPRTTETFIVRTRRGYTLRLSADHKLAVVSNGRLTLIPLRELHQGSKVLLLKGCGTPNREEPVLSRIEYARNEYNNSNRLTEIRQPDRLTAPLAYWLGFYTGNGSHCVNRMPDGAIRGVETSIAVRGGRDRTVDTLYAILSDTFGLTATVQVPPHDDCVKIRISSKMLYLWLERNELLKAHAHECRIPNSVRKAPDTIVAAFLAGLFDADGSSRGRKAGYRFSTTSKRLAEDIQLELLRLGIITTMHVQDRAGTGWRTLYTVSVVGRSSQQRFVDMIGRHSHQVDGFIAKRDSCATPWTARDLGIRYNRYAYVPSPPQTLTVATLERYAAETASPNPERTLLVEDRIATITPAGPATTYDIEVEDTHKFCAGGIYVSNSGRRGALMLTIADHHPDVLEFCRVKRNLTSVRFANISVRLSDAFMRAVEQDGPWTLWFDSPETGRIERTIRARELWDELVQGARDWAEPGCLFWDTITRMGTSQYNGMEVVSTNPCITGDTRISTSDGLVRIDELASRSAPLPDAVLDARVSPGLPAAPIARAWKTGTRPVVRVETREGYTLRCTADHRILTATRGWVPAGELRDGDRLLVQNRKGGFGARGSLELGRALGWLVGDGHVNSISDQAVLSFYGDKRTLAPLMQQAVAASVRTTARHGAPGIINVPRHNRDEIHSARLLRELAALGFDPALKARVPEGVWQGTEDMVRGFLQALFTADGTVRHASGNRNSVRLTSVSLRLLQDVQILLAQFGIPSRLYAGRRAAGTRELPNGRGGTKSYKVQTLHELALSRDGIALFAREIGFLPGSNKQETVLALAASYTRGPYRSSYTARVRSVTPDGTEDVYDLSEPVARAFIANGLTVHNCAEQPLGHGDCCDLGSINLERFVLEPFTAQARIDWDALARAARAAVRFLDNVHEYSLARHLYPLPHQEAAARRGRRVGVGILGLGDMLAELGLRYDSDEAVRTAGRVMEFIKFRAYETSADLAAEKGPFEAWDPDQHLAQEFYRAFPEPLIAKIKTQGLRNVSVLTIPPVGSGAALAGVTNGLEPIFALSYVRRSESLSQEFFHVFHPLVRTYLQRAGHEIDEAEFARTRDPHTYLKERLPEPFVTTHEIDPLKRVDMQAALQAHIDQSISSTVNLPREATAETVARVYFHAWRSGLKGISVYREGSREGVLLTPEEARRQHKLVALAETVRTTALAAAPDLQLDGGAPEEQIESVVRALADRLKGSPVQLQLAAPPEAEPLMRRPRALVGTTYRVPTATGTMFVTINELDGQPVEVFCRLGKGGSHAEADSEMAGRLISVALRLQTTVSRTERLAIIREQLEGIGGGDPYGFGPNKVKSIADAIAKAIGWHLDAKRQAPTREPETLTARTGAAVPTAEPGDEPTQTLPPMTGSSNGNLCPQCHQYSLITDQGCTKCRECGYKEC